MYSEIHNELLRGGRRVNGFTGDIPRETRLFQVGDVFTMPTNFEVYEEQLGENFRTQFIFVETTDGEIKRLYPSQLFRKVYVYNEDGEFAATVVEANGSASKLFKRYATIAEGMDALKGLTIKVSDIVNVPTLCKGKITYRVVYTFDLV